VHPEVNIMVLRRDREREIRSLEKDYEVRKALAVGSATPGWPPRWIAAVVGALARCGGAWNVSAAPIRRAKALI
jgi:hypothetical protein